MKGNSIFNVIKYLLAILFIYAGIYKIFDVKNFASQMYQYPLLPAFLIPTISIALPIFEIILGALLIFTRKVMSLLLWSALGLMLFFTAYLTMLYAMYAKPPCACGGILSAMTYPQHITFNVIFTIIAASGIYLYEKQNRTNIIS